MMDAPQELYPNDGLTVRSPRRRCEHTGPLNRMRCVLTVHEDDQHTFGGYVSVPPHWWTPEEISDFEDDLLSGRLVLPRVTAALGVEPDESMTPLQFGRGLRSGFGLLMALLPKGK